MPVSYTDRLIEEFTRDILAALPEDKRPLVEPKISAAVFTAFDRVRNVLDAAAELFLNLYR